MNNPSFSSLIDLLRQIDLRKAEVDSLRPFTPEQEGRIMQKFRLDWNYHSNAIEGNSLTYGETIAFLMEGLTAKGKPFKDHLDIKGHNEGIDYLMRLVKNHEQLCEKVVRELHNMILVEPYSTPAQTPDGQRVEKLVTLGKYKTQPNHVRTPTGEIHYYATPEETPAKMTDLVDWLREHQQKNDLHPLVLAATFHHRFVAIHPFDDGNGRMSRLLMNLILIQHGYPPVVIKQQDRQAYYYALRQADAGELAAFVEYIGLNLLHALDIQLKSARGEALEEPDDLDKKIALLKRGLEKEEVILKSSEILKKLLSQDIFPLFHEIEKQSKKLNDLFASKASLFSYKTTNSLSQQPQNLTEANGFLYERNLEKIVNSLTVIIYQYSWKEFKKSHDSFNISNSIAIEFHRFKYEITFDGEYEKRKITKTYSQKLTPEEFADLSKIFVKEALAQIKAHTSQ